MEYASLVWAGLSKNEANRLEKCNRSAARLIAKISIRADPPRHLLLACAGLKPLEVRRKVAQVKFCLKTNGIASCSMSRRLPDHLQSTVSSWMSVPSRHSMDHRSSNLSMRLPRPIKNTQRNSPLYSACSTWNALPLSLQKSPTHAVITFYFSS